MPSLETKEAQLFVSAVEAAEILGIARRSLISRVEAGTVQAAHKLPGRTGAFLFDRAYFEWLMTGSTNNETPDPDGPGGELLRLDSNQQPSGYRLGHNVTFLFPSRPSWDNTDDLPSIA